MPVEAIPISQFRFLQSLTITKWRARKLVRRLKNQCLFIYGNKTIYSENIFKKCTASVTISYCIGSLQKTYILLSVLSSWWGRMSNLEQTETANSPIHFVQNTVFPRPSGLYGGRGDPNYPKSTPPRGNSVP